MKEILPRGPGAKKQLSLEAHGAEKSDKRWSPSAQPSREQKSLILLLGTRSPCSSATEEHLCGEAPIRMLEKVEMQHGLEGSSGQQRPRILTWMHNSCLAKRGLPRRAGSGGGMLASLVRAPSSLEAPPARPAIYTCSICPESTFF